MTDCFHDGYFTFLNVIQSKNIKNGMVQVVIMSGKRDQFSIIKKPRLHRCSGTELKHF